MTGERLMAQDAMQEAFIDAFLKLDQFSGKSTFGAWLKRITVNKCITMLKKHKKLNLDPLANHTLHIAEKEENTFDISIEKLNRSINGLPAGCRTVFTLKAMEGYDHNEISEIMEISISTSKSQYSRAKSLLRKNLSKKKRVEPIESKVAGELN